MILPWRLTLILILTGLLPARPGAAAPADGEPRPVSFTHDIRPILARNCFACHGPDEKRRKGDLRLDTKAGAFDDRNGFPPFVPNSPEASEVLIRITSEDPNERMPPGKAEKRLPAAQVELIKRWIEQGAKWESHWAFEKPVKPPLPAVRDTTWPRNGLDAFVLKRLESEGLAPSPEADRRTLIRRVSLDLTGLPPTPEMVAQFLSDTSSDAYEQLVERLLGSPAYGERWARVWLDLARYADTKGYEKDLKREIWRYRDWVIDAFNNDMPYDRFTTEQLAGDLLPNATPNQILATAFHRNTLTNEEGGTDDEEFRIAAVKDRVDTTAQVWMGLTLGCAKCHSHKYDPITHDEYYKFYAFFNQTADADRGDDSPAEPFPAPEQQARIDALKAAIQKKEAELYAPTPAHAAVVRRWEESARARSSWSTLHAESFEAKSGSPMKRLDDDSILVGGDGPAKETYTIRMPAPQARITGIRLEALPDPSLPKGGVGRAKGDGNFVLTGLDVAIKTKAGDPRGLKLSVAEADFAQDKYPVEHVLKNPGVTKHGWAVAPKVTEAHQAVFRVADPVTPAEEAELVVRLDHQFEHDYPGFSLGRFRLSFTAEEAPALKPAIPQPIAAILALPEEKRTDAQRSELLRHVLGSQPETKPARDEIARLRGEVDRILASVRTPIFRELPKEQKRVTRVHKRGNFLDPGDPVEPATPSSFSPLPKDAPVNRLGVARWLLDPENPLTARVAVNRHWAQIFGRGLVETQEDFGTQGQLPLHPELLDWLAVEFRESGWSMKRLCRLIVTSATYRQTSRVTPTLLQKDRSNLLFARAPRFRMEAEMVRDNALAVSGLLSKKLHGPPVMPYQPDGIWRSTYNTDKWILSAGEDRHRRGIYTFLKRTSPYPAMMVFDAPTREFCTVRRIGTNTPLQALVTLNDPAFIEAAQALARRMVAEGGASESTRIARGLQLALIREPEPREIEALTQLYKHRLETYRADLESAQKLATDPLGPAPKASDVAELAALTAVSNVILNLDEFLTKN